MSEVIVQGCEVHYDVVDFTLPWLAAPETILFHHGLGATSGIWAEWIPLLADRFRLVTFDMRGHGRSGRPQAMGYDTSLTLLAEDVFAVANAVLAERFHIVGESIGGTIALNAAIHHPGRINTVTVSNGAHVGGKIQWVHDWRQIIAREGMAGWSKYMMGRRFFDDDISPEKWEWYEREQSNVSPDFLLQALGALVATDLSPELDKLDVPVLLMHGDSSPFIPVDLMADLKSKLRRSQLQVFCRASHGLPFSHAKDCAKTLRQFLVGPR
jgi:pimeloyl-ACP methyl ester carboxylesterase